MKTKTYTIRIGESSLFKLKGNPVFLYGDLFKDLEFVCGQMLGDFYVWETSTGITVQKGPSEMSAIYNATMHLSKMVDTYPPFVEEQRPVLEELMKDKKNYITKKKLESLR